MSKTPLETQDYLSHHSHHSVEAERERVESLSLTANHVICDIALLTELERVTPHRYVWCVVQTTTDVLHIFASIMYVCMDILYSSYCYHVCMQV